MIGAAKKLLEQALALPRASRVELVDALQQSLDADVELSDEWKAEIARRIEDIERGEAELLDGDAVLRDLRERYPERIERGEAELLDGDAVLRELRERYPER